ncbi:transposase family protein [Candidatus Sumerlaeota bacterium]|nr:transposase family protein [Candidatus Sumerlaeota bacterium]
MSRRSRREYIRTQRARYRSASRAEKGRILDEGCKLFGMHRKSLTRALNRPVVRACRKAGHPKRYGAELLGPLRKICPAAEFICSKRLKAAMPVYVRFYERHHGPLDPQVRDDLLAASPSTLDRVLKPIRAKRKGLCGTRAVRRLEGQIPIRTHFRDVEGPGTLEVDTVAHGGGSSEGQFVWSFTLTDIWSGWTENRAIWHKSARQIVARLRDIEQRLSFDVVAVDSDNGGEFINHHLWRYFYNRAQRVHFTRSRPYHKNDQAHVEQKQWTHVRQLLGYERFEDRQLVEMIDDLYRNEWRALQNFILPNVRLTSKTRRGGRVVRRYTAPATPCDRLLASDNISDAEKEKLRRERDSLDPYELHKRIEAKLKAIFDRVRLTQKPATQKKRLKGARALRPKRSQKTPLQPSIAA